MTTNTGVSRRVQSAIIITILITGSVGISLGLYFGLFANPDGLPNPDDLGTDLVPASFAEYVDYELPFSPDAPEYYLEPDLSNVLNLEDFITKQYGSWSDAIESEIAEKYYAVPGSHVSQFHTIYSINHEYEVPSFVTTDAVLHAYHTLYDIALRTIENNTLNDQLALLSKHQAEASQCLYDEVSDPAVKEAAYRNIAFFSVATKLLNPQWNVSSLVAEDVQAVLTLINSAAGFSNNWFMHQKEDFSQYIPRGHYTESESLERFFKAMVWYGRVGFRLLPAEMELTQEQNRDLGRAETRQAILATLALFRESTVMPDIGLSQSNWKSIYDITSFFVGASDDLSPFEYNIIIHEVFGNSSDPDSLANETLLDTFISTALECRDPKILSGWLIDTAHVEINTKGFRFMGQRFVPDSYVLGQLVYSNVGTLLNPRLMPKGLDVMAAFGSDLAWTLLDDQKAYENYISQMDLLRESISEMDNTTWQQNLYWLWCYSFLPLLVERDVGYPAFMRDTGWTEKQLMTALATWTELRHDTILYAKQSYSYTYGMPSVPKGYVEPFPDLYARLASLCRMMVDGLESRVDLNEDLLSTLEDLHDTLLTLQAISIKELSGIAFNSTDDDFLKSIGGILSRIEGFDGDGGKAALVTDVHTDPNSSTVLQEATGNPLVIYVAVPTSDGEPYLTRGAIYSYYEFTRSMENRLTDEAWWELLDSGDAPDMPEWTSSFIMENDIATTVVCSESSMLISALTDSAQRTRQQECSQASVQLLHKFLMD
ncbi:MAG: DUF3160 domain-containing protein [Candidatus Thorarchaeota archaeon]